MKLPLLGRAAAIAIVALLILLPIGLIGGKVSERQARARGVVAQFAQETSGPQLVAGPFLALTCEETFTEEREVMRGGKAETVAETRTTACPTTYFPPRDFTAAASMPVETRHRGIYPIRLFRAELEIAGEWEWPEPPLPNGLNPRAWKQAHIVSFVQDPRGIKAGHLPVRESIGPYAARAAGTRIPFAYKLSLLGTSSLRIAPIGERNEIRIVSDWPHPSFSDAWSPDERGISREGFSATWRVSGVATGGQPAWNKLASEGQLAKAPGAGVSLFDPVNIYALSYRATEYAFLFVLFTFAALALTEAVTGIRLHPVQYALVGSALAVFFLLLLALSEHVDFTAAYAGAAVACAALLTYYLRHPLGTFRRTLAFLALFAALYASLYTLLMSEDHAMLLGSVMVFGVLAVVMVATRRIDWNAFGKLKASS